jgi:hypothetical protein
MENENREGHWLFIVKTEDRPGAAASIAVPFSGRGIQIESFIGYGNARYYQELSEGIIAITFKTFKRRMEMVHRALLRLELVKEVHVFDYENDASLVKSATARVRGSMADVQKVLEGMSVGLNPVDTSGDDIGLVIYGRPTEVDEAVRKLTQAKCLVSSVYTILPPVI